MCTEASLRSFRAWSGRNRCNYKHSAPPELNAFRCGSAALCLCAEIFSPEVQRTTEEKSLIRFAPDFFSNLKAEL